MQMRPVRSHGDLVMTEQSLETGRDVRGVSDPLGSGHGCGLVLFSHVLGVAGEGPTEGVGSEIPVLDEG